MHGIPHFSISIALKIDNELKSALIHDPIKNEMFFADKNNGAYFNNHRIRVSKKTLLEDCLFGTNILGIKSTELNVRCLGSAALDLAYVSSGRLDGFFQNNLNIWDIAAGILIVEEAGGKVNNFGDDKISNINLRASSNDILTKMMKNLNNF